MLKFDFDNAGCVITALELNGRGIKKICTQLNGNHIYAITDKAKKQLLQKYKATYENGNGVEVAMN